MHSHTPANMVQPPVSVMSVSHTQNILNVSMATVGALHTCTAKGGEVSAAEFRTNRSADMIAGTPMDAVWVLVWRSVTTAA